MGVTPRVLIVHNRYQQAGGEDAVVAAESALLEARGHQVRRLFFDNRDIPESHSPATAARLAVGTVWSRSSASRVRAAIREFHPDVVHFHNTFPLISPAAYYAAHAEGVAVVQTLHNYRLLCPNALLYRDGHVCEECVGKAVPWPGLVYACYRGSRLQTAAVAAMLAGHRVIGTWHTAVDVYIALAEFARRTYQRGGLPPDRIVVKPNFVDPDPGVGTHAGGYTLFVGRLTPEKGIATLLAAWEHLASTVPLKIAGDGPLRSWVQEAAEQCASIEWLGRRAPAEVQALMGDARVLIFPSEWYETFGLVAAEAFAKGTPVIGSATGAIAELVDDGRTGLHFPPGDAAALAERVRWAWQHPQELRAMGAAARQAYEARYTAERSYSALLDIYGMAIERARRASGTSTT